MKHTLKAAAAVLAFITAVIIVSYILKAIGFLMIIISETCNIPL